MLAIVAALTVLLVRRASPDQAGNDAMVSLTSWQRVMGGTNESGETTVEMARQGFSLTFSPLSGVSVPDGSRRDIQSGSAALRMMIAHWAELAVEERSAVMAYLPQGDGSLTAPSATDGPAVTDGAFGSPGGAVQHVAYVRPAGPIAAAVGAGPDPATKQMIASRVEWLRAAIGSRAGKFLIGDVTLFYNAREVEAGSAAFTLVHSAGQMLVNPTVDTATVDGDLGPYSGCFISFNRYGWQLRGTELDFVIAHELYHCFEGMFIGDLDAFYSAATAPPWVMEGGANWAAAQVVPTSTYPSEAWQDYLLAPAVSLFAQSYEAIGFWNHLGESTAIDPWAALRNAVGKTSAAALANTGALTDSFLDTWASSLFRQPAFGNAWQTDGPTMSALRASPEVVAVGNGAQTSRSAVPYGKTLFYADVDSDVVVIVGVGHVTLHNASHDAAQFGQLVYCARADGCACPPGSVNTSPSPQPLGGRSVAFGVTGSARAGAVALGGISLAEWCTKKNPPITKPPSGGTGSTGPADSIDPNVDLCQQIVEREGIDGLLNNPTMSPQDIQDCIAEILASGGFGG